MHNTGSVLTSQLLAKRKSKICGEKSREFVTVFCRHGSCTWLHKLSSTTLHPVSIFYLDVSYQSRFPIYLNMNEVVTWIIYFVQTKFHCKIFHRKDDENLQQKTDEIICFQIKVVYSYIRQFIDHDLIKIEIKFQ